MPLFKYTAISYDGKVIKDKINRSSEEKVIKYINELGFKPVSIKKLGFWTKDIGDFEAFRKNLDSKKVSILCRQLSFVLGAGLVSSAGIEVIYKQTADKRIKKLLHEVNTSVLEGAGLGESFARTGVFPEFFVNMLVAGEESGSLVAVTSELADYYETESSLIENLKNAITYPVIVIILMINVLLIFILFVVPGFETLFASDEVPLPIVTELLLGFCNFISGNFVAILALFFVLLVGGFAFLHTESGHKFSDTSKLKLPIVSIIYKKVINFRFAFTMSFLISSGIDILASIEIVDKVINNTKVHVELKNLSNEIENAHSYLESIEKITFFEPLLIGMMDIGLETGTLGECMAKCTEYYRKETSALIMKTSKLVEPVIIVFLGIIITFLMLAILLPTFNMIYIT